MCITSPAFAKSEPRILPSSSAWVVDYQDDACRLMRQFGSGDDIIVISFNRYAPGQTFQLTLSGKLVERDNGGQPGEVRLQFGPNEEEQKVAFVPGTTGKLPALIMPAHMSIAADDDDKKEAYSNEQSDDDSMEESLSPERIAAVRTLTIGRPFPRPIILQLGNLGKAFSAQDTCLDNLLTTWAIDPVKHKTMTRRVRPAASPANWLRSSDYPVDMLSQNQPALVQVRLIVDTNGAPKTCYIQATTRPKAFDEAVCNGLMRRARFTPALDAEGKPMESYWRKSVRFVL